MSPPDTEETLYWYFMCRVTPQERVITEIRTRFISASAAPRGPYFSNDPLLGCYPTHKVPVESFFCIWRTHYLAGFLVGKWAFSFFPLDTWWSLVL
jgi:hypothetical protein